MIHNSYLCVLLVGASLLFACAPENSPPADTSPNEPPSAALPERNYDLDTEVLTENGCLDLSKLSLSLPLLDQDAMVIHVMNDFVHETGSGGSENPRLNFIRLAALGNFKFSETRLPSLTAKFSHITQMQCESIEISNQLGPPQSLKIVPNQNSNAIFLSLGDQSYLAYELTSPRELKVTIASKRLDPCPPYERIPLTQTEVITWGPRSELSATPIGVSKSLLEHLSNSLFEMPQSVSEALSNPTPDPSNRLVPVLPVDLKRLADTIATSQIDPGIKKCPSQPKSLDEDEPASPEPESPEPGGDLNTPQNPPPLITLNYDKSVEVRRL